MGWRHATRRAVTYRARMADDDHSLRVAGLHHRYRSATTLAGVEFTVPAGSIVALLGPSGSGKTTLLRCIAGLESPVEGVIELGERVLSDVARGISVEPEARGLGMVFQDGALFPHLDVGANVGFGLPRSQRRGSRVSEVLELVGLAGYERRAVATLSGGQRQRVALARALAPQPAVVLFDEPFSNLDALLRAELRAEVHDLLRTTSTTAVWVTHDRSEAFLLADSIAVLRRGRVLQQAPPRQIYDRPIDPWVAGFVGEVNLVPGVADGTTARTALGDVVLSDPLQGEVRVLVRPEDLRLAGIDPHGGWRVSGVAFEGHDTVVSLTGPLETVRVRTRRSAVADGDHVGVTLRTDLVATAWPI